MCIKRQLTNKKTATIKQFYLPFKFSKRPEVISILYKVVKAWNACRNTGKSTIASTATQIATKLPLFASMNFTAARYSFDCVELQKKNCQ